MERDFPHRAKDLIRQRRYQDAVRLCRGELLANPDNVEGKVVLAMAYLALQQYDQVCQVMSPVVAERPNLVPARRLLGEAHLRLGSTVEAQTHLEAAHQAAPDDPVITQLLRELEGHPRGGTARPASIRDSLDELDYLTALGSFTFAEEDDELTATGAEHSPMVLPNLDDFSSQPGGKDDFLLSPDDTLLDLSPSNTVREQTRGGSGSPSAGDHGWNDFEPPPLTAGEGRALSPGKAQDDLLDDDDATIVGDAPDLDRIRGAAPTDRPERTFDPREEPNVAPEARRDGERPPADDRTVATSLPEYRQDPRTEPSDIADELGVETMAVRAPEFREPPTEQDRRPPSPAEDVLDDTTLTDAPRVEEHSGEHRRFDAVDDDRTMATVLPEYRKHLERSTPASFPQAYSQPLKRGGSDLMPAFGMETDERDQRQDSAGPDPAAGPGGSEVAATSVSPGQRRGEPAPSQLPEEPLPAGQGLHDVPTASRELAAALGPPAEGVEPDLGDIDDPTEATELPSHAMDEETSPPESQDFGDTASMEQAAPTEAVQLPPEAGGTPARLDEEDTAALQLPQEADEGSPRPDEEDTAALQLPYEADEGSPRPDEEDTAALQLPSRDREAEQIFASPPAQPPPPSEVSPRRSQLSAKPAAPPRSIAEETTQPVETEAKAPSEVEAAPSPPRQPEPPPPVVEIDPLDPDATRVLDVASAAIIRAQAGAPMRQAATPTKEGLDREGPGQGLMDFDESFEPRDIEGTDSFSPMAEGTMVDEDSIYSLREQLLTQGKGKGKGKAKQEIKADAVTSRPAVEERGGRPGSSDRAVSASGAGAASSESPAPPAAPGGEDRSPAPEPAKEKERSPIPNLPPAPNYERMTKKHPPRPAEDEDEELFGAPLGRTPKRTIPLGLGTRDPESSTKVLESSGEPRRMTLPLGMTAQGHGDDVKQEAKDRDDRGADEKGSGDEAAVAPGSAKRLLEKLRGGKAPKDKVSKSSAAPPRVEPKKKDEERRPVSSYAPPPPPPLPGADKPAPSRLGSEAQTAAAVPALRGADLPAESEEVRSSGKTAVHEGAAAEPAPIDQLGSEAADSDPLDQPFDPRDFPDRPPPFLEVETSIPLKTGDLLSSRQAPAAPPRVPRTGPPEVPLPRGDYSSHRIPLPETLSDQSPYSLDQPFNPKEFDRARKAEVRSLPPVGQAKGPISIGDLTPGPRLIQEAKDPLSTPFWPGDFDDDNLKQTRDAAFFTFKPQGAAPRHPSMEPPHLDDEDEEDDLARTGAFEPAAMGPYASSPVPPSPSFPPPAEPEQPVRVAASSPPRAPDSPRPPYQPTLNEMGGSSMPSPIRESLQEPVRESLQERIRPARPDREPGPASRADDRGRQRRSAAEPAKKPQGRRKPARAMKGAKKRPKTTAILVGVGIALLVIGVGVTIGVLALMNARDLEQQRLEAQSVLAQGNYRDYQQAIQIYSQMIEDHSSDESILAEAARIHAVTALEFGTGDDDRAEELIHRAVEQGATEHQLAPARAAVDLYRGDLVGADQVLTAVQSSTGEYAGELIYLRGLWYLKRESNREALRRFRAAAEAAPGASDIRMLLAWAKALYAQRDHQGAFQKLEEVDRQTQQRNVASKLLRAKINIETGRDPGGGEAVARYVIEELGNEASPGQLGWAKLLRARYLALSEKQIEARGVIEDALENRPIRDAEFSALVAQTLLDLGDPSTARQEAKRAVELASHLQRYRLLLAEALVEEGDLATAESHLRPVSNSPKASLLQGRIRLARGDLEGAAQRFEEAAQGEREAPQAKLFLAEIHLKQGRTRQAIELLERLAEGPPALPQARVMLGEAYMATNQLEEAQAALEQASRDLPGDAKVSIALGKLYARQGDHTRAVGAVQDALEIEPTNPSALVTLGNLQLRAGNYDQAADAFDRALKGRAVGSEALIGRARTATAQRDFATAQEYLTKAAKQAMPGQIELARGELKVKQYTPAEAIPLLQKAIESLPHEPLAHTLLGDAYVMQGGSPRLHKARNAYEEALKLRSDFPEAIVGQAEAAMLSSNNFRHAKQAIDRAVEVVGDATVTPTLKARVYTLEGRYAFEIDYNVNSARDSLSKALALDENLAEAHLSLGFLSADQGDERQACTHFRRYLELAENGPEVDVADARRGVRDNCR